MQYVIPIRGGYYIWGGRYVIPTSSVLYGLDLTFMLYNTNKTGMFLGLISITFAM